MADRFNVSNQPAARKSKDEPSPVPKGKLVFLVVVIVATVSWIVYLLMADRQTADPLPAGTVAHQNIIRAIGEREDLLGKVVFDVLGEPPEQSIRVTGVVKSQALLSELRAKVDEGKGDVPVDFKVTVQP